MHDFIVWIISRLAEDAKDDLLVDVGWDVGCWWDDLYSLYDHVYSYPVVRKLSTLLETPGPWRKFMISKAAKYNNNVGKPHSTTIYDHFMAIS